MNAALTRLFSADDDRELPASLMDSLTLTLFVLPLWYVHDIVATTDIVTRPLAPSFYVGVLTIGILTFAVSILTTIAQQEYSFRPEPHIGKHRSPWLTVAAAAMALVATTYLGMFLNGLIPNNSLAPNDPLHVALTFGVVVIPATIRLTSPYAFTYKPEYFQEEAGPIIGHLPA